MNRTRWLQTAGLLVFGLLILYGLLQLVHPAQVGAAMVHASPPLLLLGMASSFGFILIRSWRWQLILQASSPETRLADATAVTSLGFGLNAVSPFKLGELLRIAMISQRAHVGLGEAGATVVLERVLDVLTLLVLAVATAVLTGGPSASLGVWSGLAVLSALSLLFGFTAYFATGHADATLRIVATGARILPARFQPRVTGLVSSALKGFNLLRSPRRFALTGLVSLAVWIVPILGLIAYVRSITPLLSLSTLFLALTLFTITQAISVTPASVGTFEGLFVLVLGAFGAGHASTFTAVALVAHLAGTVALVLAGAVGALWLRFRPGGLPVGLERPVVSQNGA